MHRSPHAPLVLRAKLRAPRVMDRVIGRPRLVAALSSGSTSSLSLVCAPAGYGKTTLLAEWAASQGEVPVAWVALEPTDREPARLWSHVIAAISRSHPPASRAAEVAEIPGADQADTIVPILLESLEDIGPMVLVIDDWHYIQDAESSRAMARFVELHPPELQLVIATRSEPQIGVPRLRATGALTEIRAADLSLTLDEACAVLARTHPGLPADAVAALLARTGGWPAGVHLASLLMTGHEDGESYLRQFSGGERPVVDYLAGEVLDVLSPDQRSFVLDTSILDRLTGPACDELLETTGSDPRLREVFQAGLFLQSLDDSGETYAFHQLFANVLRRVLRQGDPDRYRALHERASDLAVQRGDVVAGVDHAIAARSTNRTRALVSGHARTLWTAGRASTLASWFDALDWPEVISDPEVALARAAVAGLEARPIPEIEGHLRVAEAGMGEGLAGFGSTTLETGVWLTRALFAPQRLGEIVSDAACFIARETPDRGWLRPSLLALGQAHYLRGDRAEARSALEAALPLAHEDQQAIAAAACHGYLAHLDLDAQDVEAAAAHVRRAIRLVIDGGIDRGLAAVGPLLASGRLAFITHGGSDGLVELERAVELSCLGSPSLHHAHALARYAEALAALGRIEEQRATLDAARAALPAQAEAGLVEGLIRSLEARPGVAAQESPPDRLGPRELDVLRMFRSDLTEVQIARELFLSVNTIKTHRRSIFRKLGAHTRAQAVARGRESGII